MLVTAPLRFLNMFLGHYHAGRTMKPGAVDQTGLIGLELLTGDDVIVNIDNHDEILSMKLILTYQRAPSSGKALRFGVLQCWSDGIRIASLLHHSKFFFRRPTQHQA